MKPILFNTEMDEKVKEAGNDLPNFAEVIWDDDIETILADCRKLGVREFTISSTFSSLLERGRE